MFCILVAKMGDLYKGSLRIVFQAKVVIAEQTEKDIDETRSQYIPVAVRTQILFFCTYDLVSNAYAVVFQITWSSCDYHMLGHHMIESTTVCNLGNMFYVQFWGLS